MSVRAVEYWAITIGVGPAEKPLSFSLSLSSSSLPPLLYSPLSLSPFFSFRNNTHT
jgi:hypothetical protein